MLSTTSLEISLDCHADAREIEYERAQATAAEPATRP
jgi:hypothetical protein